MLAAQVSLARGIYKYMSLLQAKLCLLKSSCMVRMQNPSNVPGPESMPGVKTAQYFPDVATAALEVLRQGASIDELKRYMRKLHDRQHNAEQAELVTFELVYLLAERVRSQP